MREAWSHVCRKGCGHNSRGGIVEPPRCVGGLVFLPTTSSRGPCTAIGAAGVAAGTLLAPAKERLYRATVAIVEDWYARRTPVRRLLDAPEHCP